MFRAHKDATLVGRLNLSEDSIRIIYQTLCFTAQKINIESREISFTGSLKVKAGIVWWYDKEVPSYNIVIKTS